MSVSKEERTIFRRIKMNKMCAAAGFKGLHCAYDATFEKTLTDESVSWFKQKIDVFFQDVVNGITNEVPPYIFVLGLWKYVVNENPKNGDLVLFRLGFRSSPEFGVIICPGGMTANYTDDKDVTQLESHNKLIRKLRRLQSKAQ